MNDTMNRDGFVHADKIVPAVYSQQEIPIYAGNMYIEALPHPFVSVTDFYKEMTYVPSLTPEELALPTEYLAHYDFYLHSFYLPNAFHFHVQRTIDVMIRQCYVNSLNVDNNTCREVATEKYGIQVERDTTIQTLMITGLSGCGKSKMITKILSRYPTVILHTSHNGKQCFDYQIPYLKIEIPPAADIKNLCISICRAIDDLFPSTDTLSSYAKTIAAKRQIEYVDKLLKRHHVGLLVIDEIQNIKHLSTAASRTMMDFLLQLQNVISTPMVLVGTPDAEKMLSGSLKNSRRVANSVHVHPFENNSAWANFVKALTTMSYINTEYSEELSDYLFSAACGIPDIAIKLFSHAQLRAILTGEPSVSVRIIKVVEKDSLSPLRPILNAMRKNDKIMLKVIADIPTDRRFGDYLAEEQQKKQPPNLSPENIEMIEKKARIEAKVHALGMSHIICKQAVNIIFQGATIFLSEAEITRMVSKEAIRLFQEQEEFGPKLEVVSSASSQKKKNEKKVLLDVVQKKYETDYLDPTAE